MNLSLVQDRNKLHETLIKLKDLKKKSENPDHAEALSEVFFRLALHPCTPLNEAIGYLLDAQRIDGANPRYAYHLARIFYNFGNLDLAGRWLTKASNLCPTSHRLWVHISLLHHELNPCFNEKNEFEKNALQKRSADIFKAIKKGQDHFNEEYINFTPPLSQSYFENEARKKGLSLDAAVRHAKEKIKNNIISSEKAVVQRIINPGRCRWSGVIDLEIECLLEDEPSERIRDKILPLMKQAFAISAQRNTGVTAMTILSAEWLLTGYSPSSIRQLLEKIQPIPNSVALATLHLILTLFEAKNEELPTLLANALTNRQLPPAIVALIHSRRLLWRPTIFKAIGKYLAAKKIVKEHEKKDVTSKINEKANALIKTIIDAVNKIDIPSPVSIPEAKLDEGIESVSNCEACTILRKLTASSQKLKEIHEKAFHFLRDELDKQATMIDSSERYASIAKDCECFYEILIQFELAGALGLSAKDRLLRQIQRASAEELDREFSPNTTEELRRNSFALKIEECKNTFGEVKMPANIIKMLKRIEIKLKAKSEKNTGVVISPSKKIVALIEEIKTIILQEGSNASTGYPDSQNDTFASLVSENEKIKQILGAYWDQLMQLVAAQKKRQLSMDELNLAYEIKEFIDNLSKRCERVLEIVLSLRASIDSGSKQEQKVVELESAFREHITAQGRFGRSLIKLKLPQKISHRPEAGMASISTVDTSDAKLENLSGIQGLTRAIDIVDFEIDRIINLNIQSFNAYSNLQRTLPELQVLQLNILSQAAEILYRMQRYSHARELWLHCLSIDRLFIPALKNIAVCETLHGNDHSLSLSAWKSYCEVLYLHAVVAENPRISATARAEFHRDFASAFSKGYFSDDKEDVQNRDKNKPQKFLDLIDSPGILKEFIAHKCAELLNCWFEMQTPTLLLGVSRSVGKQEERIKVKGALEKMIESVCSELPDRIGPAFKKICIMNLDSALETCKTTKGLTEKNNPHYHEDEKHLTHWIRSVYKLKEQFYFGFNCMPEKFPDGKTRFEWQNKIQYLDFIFLLDKLNVFPLDDLNNQLVESVFSTIAKRYGKPGTLKKKDLDDFVYNLCAMLVMNKNEMVIKSLFGNVEFWIKVVNKNLDIADWLDTPKKMSEEMNSFFNQLNENSATPAEIEEAKNALKKWCEQCPQLAGPAFHYGRLLYQSNHTPEAAECFKTCIENAFSAKLKEAAQSFLNKIQTENKFNEAIKKGDFQTVVDTIKDELAQSPGSIEQINSLLSVYQQWIEKKPSEACQLISQIEDDISNAIFKAQADPNNSVIKTQMDLLVENKRQIILTAAFREIGQLDDAEKSKKLTPILKNIVEKDGNNIYAVFYLAQCAYFIGAQKLSGTSGRDGKEELKEAIGYAKRVRIEAVDKSFREGAEKMINEIESVLEQI